MSQALANDISLLADDPALAPFLKDGMAAFVWSGDAARLIWVSPAGQELAERLAPGGRLDIPSSLRDRIAILASGLAPRRGVRLERLRLVPGSNSVLTCACHSLTLADGSSALLTAIVGRIPDLAAPAPPPPPIADDRIAEPQEPQEPTADSTGDVAVDDPLAEPGATDVGGPSREGGAAGQQGPAVEAVPVQVGGEPVRPRLSRARFLWETGPDGRLIRLGPVFRELFAHEPVQRQVDPLGIDWLELVSRLELTSQPDARLAEALAGEAAWSLRNLSWRLSGGQNMTPVDLSAVPVRDPSGEFSGFRGFGVVRLDETRPAPRMPATGSSFAVDRTVSLPRPEADIAPVHAEDHGDLNEADFEDCDLEERDVERAGPQTVGLADAPADTIRGETQARFIPFFTAQAEIMPLELPPDSRQTGAGEPLAGSLTAGDEHFAAEDIAGAAAGIDPVEQPVADTGFKEADDPDEDGAEAAQSAGGDLIAAAGAEVDDAGAVRQDITDPADSMPAAPRMTVGTSVPSATSPDEETSATGERLTASERNAFREIARALGARLSDNAATRPSEAGPSNVTPLRRAVVSAAAGMPSARHESFGPVAVEPPAGPPGIAAAADFAQLIDRLPVGVLISRDGEALYANRTLLDLAGYADLAALDAAGGPATLIEGPIHTPETEIAAMGLITAEGARVPVEVKLSSIVWQGAPATSMEFRRTSVVDVAARLKAVELDLKAREARIRELSSILDTATDGTVVLDERGRIVALNRSAEALFGYDQNEVVGEPFTLLIAPESHPMALDYLEGLKSNGVASILNDGREVIGRVRQGGRIALFMTMGAVAREPELKFCAVLRDMTAWKNAERELIEARRAAEQASAQKSDFLAKISHEIRTPLNAIIGFAEVMLEERFGPVGNERYKDYLRDIHSSGGHVISLVNDLLDLAKIEAGRLELSFASVDVNNVVASCVSLLQPQAQRGRIVLRTSLAQKLPAIVADERSLRQVALNLLSNAVKFTDPGGQVIVSTALTERGEVALRVRDTGVGMAEAEIKAAMEPFRQLATSRRTGGTGLGLPLTKALIEANRGSFAITSAKGEGTLVEVLFPPTRVLAS
jgi:PAS domain S-box-containing protein